MQVIKISTVLRATINQSIRIIIAVQQSKTITRSTKVQIANQSLERRKSFSWCWKESTDDAEMTPQGSTFQVLAAAKGKSSASDNW